MKTMPEWLILICRIVIIVGIPVALTLTNVRLLMTHASPEVIYGLPGFPDDFYGFSKAQRLYWSRRSLDYILGDPRAGRIEAWKFPEDGISPDGTTAPTRETCADYGAQYGARDCTYFYNDREVKHMVDVRNVTGGALAVWVMLGSVTLAAMGALYYFHETAALRGALLWGALTTFVILISLVVFMGVGFNTFFVYFHRVFFEGESWIFLWSDSLIRLFPLPFWFNAFMFVGLATLAEAGLVAALAWWGLK
jgi:integral membrane protein (TIGR01906 family)